jgi:hypothetical protein
LPFCHFLASQALSAVVSMDSASHTSAPSRISRSMSSQSSAADLLYHIAKDAERGRDLDRVRGLRSGRGAEQKCRRKYELHEYAGFHDTNLLTPV